MAALPDWMCPPRAEGWFAEDLDRLPGAPRQPERRRLRVGDYRVICAIDNDELIVWVIRVGHRSTIHDT